MSLSGTPTAGSLPETRRPLSGGDRWYKFISALCAVVFAVVGLIFLLAPAGVLRFFNELSIPLGMQTAPVEGAGFYVALSVGYMYVVALLAFLMFRHPDNPAYPTLLIHAKAASSVLSLFLFIVFASYLILLLNCLVDGMIAVLIAVLRARRMRVPV